MQKQSKKLSLKKLEITKLTNLGIILGGAPPGTQGTASYIPQSSCVISTDCVTGTKDCTPGTPGKDGSNGAP